ncbi:MAG: aldo/keto reductase [Candidatus Acidiferrales bacterium]|jgi:aryl-alcohol dehydrogenase-like predicted oxidoreductase
MEFVTIAGTNLKASRIGLGTWAIGGLEWGGTDEHESIRTIHAAIDKGITLIDTAPIYGFGRSEEIVGKALAESGQREKVLIATKAGLEWKGQDVTRNSSRARILSELEDSLKRLQTSYIDIYQVHWPDGGVPLEETAETLAQLLRQGKIRAIGVSNFSPQEMDRFRAAAPLHTLQPPYNVFEREVERDVLPYARQHNLTTLTYGAICRGLLSGRMTADTKFSGDDLRQVDPKFQSPRFGQYLEAVGRLDRLARERYGKSVLELAIRWVLDQPGVSIALWGARHPQQLTPLENLFGWKLDVDALQNIDQIVRETVKDPAGPEFLAPPVRGASASA